MTILFAGGGTLGPVMPLVAVARRMRKMRTSITFAWAGTAEGPERGIVEREHIAFHVIPTVKLPRFFSIAWFTWPWRYANARRSARKLLDRVKPALVIGAGGFTQVPIIHEASRRGIPCAIHQLDIQPGVSNRLVARRCASVTTSFDYQKPPFGSVKTERAATPTRYANVSVPDKEAATARFFLEPHKPVVFMFGGGTGARALNEAVREMKDRLDASIQILHGTGKGKLGNARSDRRYIVREFFDEQDFLFACAAADIVVCRAGMGTLTDLAALRKATIVIPIPESHQEENAHAVSQGVIILEQATDLVGELQQAIEDLLSNPTEKNELGNVLNQILPTDDGTELAERWIRFVD